MYSPVWTADGHHLILQGPGGLYLARADAAKEPQLFIRGGALIPGTMADDGRRLPFCEWNSSSPEIRTVPVRYDSGEPKAGEPELFIPVKTGTAGPAFSPDGRWLAYTDTGSGTNEVYVRAYPDRGERWQVSNNGGAKPVWSRTKHELLYQTEDSRLMVARYMIRGESFISEKPSPWNSPHLAKVGLAPIFDLAPDGEHIAALLQADTPESRETLNHVMVMLNFPWEVRRRMEQ